MSTSKSGINLIDPEEYRPPLQFIEGGIVVTSFGGTVVAVGNLETDGEIVAELDGKETMRYPHKAGKIEIRRSEFIDETIWQARASAVLLRIFTVENGTVTFELKTRFTNDYTREYDAWRKRDYAMQKQRELLNTRRGVNELLQSLHRIVQDSAVMRSYVGSGDVAKGLARLACDFLAVDQWTNLEPRQVLEVFLEDDAIEVATSLPNEYWFAIVLRTAFGGNDNSFAKLSRTKLEEAMRSVATPIREQVAARSENGSELRMVLQAVEGITVVGESGLKVNPIFAL